MSRTQFHSIDSFILRHAWLNLWDKRMTTGRINQIAIALRTSLGRNTHTTARRWGIPYSARRHTTPHQIGTTFGTAGGSGNLPRNQPTITAWCVFRIHRFFYHTSRGNLMLRSVYTHTALSICHGLSNNSRWRERPSRARALVVDRSLCLRNNATVTEIATPGGMIT